MKFLSFILLIWIPLFFFNYQSLSKDFIFSSKIIGDDYTKGELFVVNGNDYFVRYVNGDKFGYKMPNDGCFACENGNVVCIKDKKVFIEGKQHTIIYEDKIKKGKHFDYFFNEKNLECDLMKFDLINRIFIKKEEIEGFEMQLYLPDYFSVLRIIVYKKNDDKNLYAFVLSDKNEIGCSVFNDYIVYNDIKKEDNGVGKKNKKNKKIIAKTKKEFLKKLSIETYKKMLLEGYTYITPVFNLKQDINDIVLSIQNDKVNHINSVAVDLEWKLLSYNDLYTYYEPIIDVEKKQKKTKKGEVINKKKISGGAVGAVVN